MRRAPLKPDTRQVRTHVTSDIGSVLLDCVASSASMFTIERDAASRIARHRADVHCRERSYKGGHLRHLAACHMPGRWHLRAGYADFNSAHQVAVALGTHQFRAS